MILFKVFLMIAFHVLPRPFFIDKKRTKKSRATDPLRLQAGVSSSAEAIDGLFLVVLFFLCLALRFFL